MNKFLSSFVAGTTFLLVACGSEPEKYTPKQPPMEEKSPQTHLQDVTPHLTAVNRTWDLVQQTCWDEKSKTLFVQFPPTSPKRADGVDEYYTGWQVVENYKFKELGNGTQVFIGDTLTSVAPDVTGLPCVMQSIIK